jgi:hypothetical protein
MTSQVIPSFPYHHSPENQPSVLATIFRSVVQKCPGQMLVPAILIPLQAISVAQIVCDRWLLQEVTANDFWAVVLLSRFLGL